jgi:hypothetical protein
MVMAIETQTPIGSRDIASLLRFTLQIEASSLQPFFSHLQSSDLNAMRRVCSELQECLDAHDWEVRKATMLRSLKEVCVFSGAVYAIFWAMSKKNGALHAMCHYNPPRRIEEVKNVLGEDSLYSTESYGFQFLPGQGLVGEVFKGKGRLIFQDITELPEEIYLRKRQAQRFGIKSVVLTWYKDGVLEFGTTDKWSGFDWVTTLPDPLLGYHGVCSFGS